MRASEMRAGRIKKEERNVPELKAKRDSQIGP